LFSNRAFLVKHFSLSKAFIKGFLMI